MLPTQGIPAGATGPTGIQGIQGITGPQGIQGEALTTVTKTEDYTANNYECILADTADGNVTITLPAPAKDTLVAIVKFDLSNILTIVANDGEDIHIVSTEAVGSITIPNSSLSHHVFISDGTDWYAISEYIQSFD